MMVRLRRVELPPPFGDQALNLARLPFRHNRMMNLIHDCFVRACSPLMSAPV